MSRIGSIQLPTTDDPNFVAYLQYVLGVIVQAINGQISFGAGTSGRSGENVYCYFHAGTSPSPAGTEVAITHGKGKALANRVLLRCGAAMTVYDGTTANTVNTSYVRFDVASTSYTLMLF